MEFSLKNDVLLCFSDKYVSDAQELHEHVLRLNHDSEENGTSINCMRISFDHEYPFKNVTVGVKYLKMKLNKFS